jgi:hypothetical protein
MNNVIAGLVVVIGVLGGFYGGAKYGRAHPTSSTAAAAASPTPAAGAGARGGAAGGRAGTGGGAALGGGAPTVAGQIVAVDGGTITVHDRQTDKDVKVNIAGARISKTVQGTAADLTQNDAVTVSGQTGPDGVVNAQVVAVGGGGAFGGAGGRARPSPSG